MTKDKSNMPIPHRGVYKRAGSAYWQLRIKVPADLTSVYPSEWAYRGSLETADLREANERAAKLWAEWLAKFDEQRKAVNAQKADKITPEMAQVLAQRVSAKALAWDEKLRTDPEAARLLLTHVHAAVPSRLTIGPAPLPSWATDPIDPLEGLPEDLAASLSNLNQGMDMAAATQMALQRIASVLPIAQNEARKLGFEFDTKTPGALEALRECLKAYRKARQSIRMRDVGEVVDTPEPALLPVVKHEKAVKLREVFERWKGVKRRSDDSVRACERALKLFEDRTGNPPVQLITRAQGDDFRAWLQTLGTSSKTAHDRITWVKSLLVYAYRDLELITRQPWEGIDIEHRTEKPRKPWTDSELKTFFKLPLFTRYELPIDFKAGKDAAYWIPLLGLYTGARVGELCQLRVQDVEKTKVGPFIRITEEAEGATVKTEAGIRRVPIHPELVRLGFMEYVDAMRKSGAVNLWPAMKFRKGKPGAYFSDWVNAFHKEATGNPNAPVFHELRHTVRTALHRARVDPLVIDRLVGHESSGMSKVQRTYTHTHDDDLAASIALLSYTAVKLKKVYRSTPQRA